MLGRRKLPEMVFQAEQTDEGDFVARTADGLIIARSESFEVLKRATVQAVSVHLKNYPGKILIRLHLSKISTSLLVGYLAMIYAWMVEVGALLLQIFSKKKPDALTHAMLLGAVFVLTGLAWRRRQEFRALRGAIGRTPLTRVQMLIVVCFVLALSILLVVVCARLVGR
jgi:hypothetical protein